MCVGGGGGPGCPVALTTLTVRTNPGRGPPKVSFSFMFLHPNFEVEKILNKNVLQFDAYCPLGDRIL